MFVLLGKTYVLRKSIFGPVLSWVVYLMREIIMGRLHDSRTDQTRTRWVGGKGSPLYHPRYTDSRPPEQGKQFTLYSAKVFFFFVLLHVYSIFFFFLLLQQRCNFIIQRILTFRCQIISSYKKKFFLQSSVINDTKVLGGLWNAWLKEMLKKWIIKIGKHKSWIKTRITHNYTFYYSRAIRLKEIYY